MSNIAVRRDIGNKPAPVSSEQRWDPYRMMRELMGFDPFREMAPYAPSASSFVPAFEVRETKDGYNFKADVPGVKEADLDVTVTGNRLTISGKREAEKQEQAETYYAYERSYGEFTRVFTLPDGVDTNSARADLKDGVFTLWIQKTPEAQPKRIAVQSAAKKS